MVGRWVVARLPVIKAVAGLSPTILTDLESSRDGELNDTQLDLLWTDRSLGRFFMLILSLSLAFPSFVLLPSLGLKPLPSKVCWYIVRSVWYKVSPSYYLVTIAY